MLIGIRPWPNASNLYPLHPAPCTVHPTPCILQYAPSPPPRPHVHVRSLNKLEVGNCRHDALLPARPSAAQIPSGGRPLLLGPGGAAAGEDTGGPGAEEGEGGGMLCYDMLREAVLCYATLCYATL